MTSQLPSKQTTSSPIVKRCVNLDWLEVHAREPIEEPRNAQYYRNRGFVVSERDYGTRVYREMFVLLTESGEALLEIRRNPASQGLHGIHDPNECHIRLTNRTCYFDNAAELLERFLRGNNYSDVRISRVDICLDFVRFDKGDAPQAFVRRYFRHKYAKINQGNIAGHGEDTWSGQEWNSISWGSKSSAIGTKMYNKTMELYDVKSDSYKKPYIRQAWCIAGLVDDWQNVKKDGETVNIWRVEFSIRSAVKNWVPIEINGIAKNYQSIRNTLDVYAGRDKMLVMFASLANHYFHFKKYEEGQRKDRCKDKILFDFSGIQQTYKVGRANYVAASGQIIKESYNRLIAKLRAFQQSHSIGEIHKACDIIIAAMTEDNLRYELENPWSREELLTMRLLMKNRIENPDMSLEVVMSEVKKLLSITDRTIDVF